MTPGTGTIPIAPGANPGADGLTVHDREAPSMNHFGEPALQEWVADAQIDEAARRRRRLTSWNIHGGDDATFDGIVTDLAERGCDVTMTLTNGHRHRGALVAIHGAWSILVTPRGGRLAVRKRAILAIDCSELLRSFGDRILFAPELNEARVAEGANPEFTPRSPEADDRVVIEWLVGPGEMLTIWSGLLMTRGELRSLSQDLAVVVSPEGVRYVPLAGVDEVIGSNCS